MKIVNCQMCGAPLRIEGDPPYVTCEYCASTNAVPKTNEERIINLFNKANNYRLQSEFDRAMTTYDNILDEDNESAEAHWGIVLCKYGVEYVEDSVGTRIPTCHRARFESVFADPDYKAAIEYADPYARLLFEGEAKAIANIQKHIIDISSNEKPYDVFLCYKETDDFTKSRTEDSGYTQEIYSFLTGEKLRVFYARFSLREFAGTEYEPHIFAALNSAKVMIVFGTKREYFMAPWVRNEWGRFLSIAKEKKDKVLIPCYKDMDPYDLPRDFSNYEALNYDTPTFMLDLIRNIRRSIVVKEEVKPVQARTVVQSTLSGNAEALTKRGYIHLEEREFSDALQCFNKALDQNPEGSKTYWGMLLGNTQCRNNQDLIYRGKPITNVTEYKKAIRFASVSEQQEYNQVVQGITDKIDNTIKKLKKEENRRIKALNFDKILNDEQAEMNRLTNQIHSNLAALEKVENSILGTKEKCAQFVNQIRNETSDIHKKATEVKGSLPSNHLLTNGEMSDYSAKISGIKEEKNKMQERFNQLIHGNAEFRQLADYQNNQKQLRSKIQDDTNQLNKMISRMNNRVERIEAIQKEFDIAYSEVRVGDYKSASKLITV